MSSHDALDQMQLGVRAGLQLLSMTWLKLVTTTLKLTTLSEDGLHAAIST